MRKFAFVLAVMLVLAVPSSAFAAQPMTGHFSSGFDFWQSYSGCWGPACFYGQTVNVHYVSTNTWTWIVYGSDAENSDVRENLEQTGTADVYDASGNLIDTRPFHCIEKFFDAGGNNSALWGTWYNANAGPNYWFSSTMEQYHYLWQINGVYQFECWNKNGSINWGWRSGSCTWASDQDKTYPPHPPHP